MPQASPFAATARSCRRKRPSCAASSANSPPARARRQSPSTSTRRTFLVRSADTGATPLCGHVIRGTGVINNELYAGVLIWNRLHYVKDPATGKRVSRANPPAKWIRAEVPHLRIVEDDLWQAVKERQKSIASQFEAVAIATRKARARRLHTMKRPVSLLSGLLTCGCSGGRYGLFTRDRYACLNHRRRGICDKHHGRDRGWPVPTFDESENGRPGEAEGGDHRPSGSGAACAHFFISGSRILGSADLSWTLNLLFRGALPLDSGGFRWRAFKSTRSMANASLQRHL